MAFKRSYSVYFQIIVVSIAFLLFVALVCGAAAIGFFSVYPAHDIKTVTNGRMSMLASNLSDNSSVQIQSSSGDSTQVATNTLITTTQVMFNISTFSNTTEIDTTIQILINTTSSPPATTINTSNSLVNFFNSTTSNLTQIAPIIILHSIVQSTIQPTVQPITRKISKTTNKKISGLTAPKINKNLATTSPRENLFYSAFQANRFASFKSPLSPNNFLGFCTLTDNTGVTYNYITDYYGYVFIFDIDWFYLGYAYELPSPLYYCIGLNSTKSLYLTSSTGLYQFDQDFNQIKSYKKHDSLWQLYFNSGFIHVTSTDDNGIFVFTTSLELHHVISLSSNQYSSAIAGIGNQMYVGVYDIKTAKNNISVYVNDVIVNSWKACGDAENTQIRSLIVDNNGYMLYSCDIYDDDGTLSGTKVFFDVLDNAGKYVTYKYFDWNAEIFGMYYDIKSRQVTVSRNKVTIWA